MIHDVTGDLMYHFCDILIALITCFSQLWTMSVKLKWQLSYISNLALRECPTFQDIQLWVLTNQFDASKSIASSSSNQEGILLNKIFVSNVSPTSATKSVSRRKAVANLRYNYSGRNKAGFRTQKLIQIISRKQRCWIGSYFSLRHLPITLPDINQPKLIA